MGSLTSRPKTTSTPQVVYVTAPTTTTSTSSSTAATGTTSGTSAEEIASDVREDGLLSRDRSRYGTVQTSFRGLLSVSDGSGRKTLLGE